MRVSARWRCSKSNGEKKNFLEGVLKWVGNRHKQHNARKKKKAPGLLEETSFPPIAQLFLGFSPSSWPQKGSRRRLGPWCVCVRVFTISKRKKQFLLLFDSHREWLLCQVIICVQLDDFVEEFV